MIYEADLGERRCVSATCLTFLQIPSARTDAVSVVNLGDIEWASRQQFS